MKVFHLTLMLSLCGLELTTNAALSAATQFNGDRRAVGAANAMCAANGVYTPRVGSGERKAILNSFRAVWLKGSNYKNVIFVVEHLAVKSGWAYLFVSPQSPDGKNHYEAEGALLRRQNGKWKVLQRIGGETECDLSCLKRKFPQMPNAIYPS